LASTIIRDGDRHGQKPTQDPVDAASREADTRPFAGTSSVLPEPGETEEHIDLVYSNRDALSLELRWPGIRQWPRSQFREFFAPSGHLIYGCRDASDGLRAALVCRDEVYAGEKAVRPWAWYADPSLGPKARDKATMKVYVACARDAVSRNRAEAFQFREVNSERASICAQLLREAL
jgi:hypothetical protein